MKGLCFQVRNELTPRKRSLRPSKSEKETVGELRQECLSPTVVPDTDHGSIFVIQSSEKRYLFSGVGGDERRALTVEFSSHSVAFVWGFYRSSPLDQYLLVLSSQFGFHLVFTFTASSYDQQKHFWLIDC
ncbi:unnamed protein product [Lactuca saligna]|uniref:Uncharacterized protein n=1 Tax=Lactuca saligna TaxID=75948 RepID=A0AA36EH01_LACSI|nr:unnamed protein product [Lactuca saligna]